MHRSNSSPSPTSSPLASPRVGSLPAAPSSLPSRDIQFQPQPTSLSPLQAFLDVLKTEYQSSILIGGHIDQKLAAACLDLERNSLIFIPSSSESALTEEQKAHIECNLLLTAYIPDAAARRSFLKGFFYEAAPPKNLQYEFSELKLILRSFLKENNLFKQIISKNFTLLGKIIKCLHLSGQDHALILLLKTLPNFSLDHVAQLAQHIWNTLQPTDSQQPLSLQQRAVLTRHCLDALRELSPSQFQGVNPNDLTFLGTWIGRLHVEGPLHPLCSFLKTHSDLSLLDVVNLAQDRKSVV